MFPSKQKSVVFGAEFCIKKLYKTLLKLMDIC